MTVFCSLLYGCFRCACFLWFSALCRVPPPCERHRLSLISLYHSLSSAYRSISISLSLSLSSLRSLQVFYFSSFRLSRSPLHTFRLCPWRPFLLGDERSRTPLSSTFVFRWVAFVGWHDSFGGAVCSTWLAAHRNPHTCLGACATIPAASQTKRTPRRQPKTKEKKVEAKVKCKTTPADMACQ